MSRPVPLLLAAVAWALVPQANRITAQETGDPQPGSASQQSEDAQEVQEHEGEEDPASIEELQTFQPDLTRDSLDDVRDRIQERAEDRQSDRAERQDDRQQDRAQRQIDRGQDRAFQRQQRQQDLNFGARFTDDDDALRVGSITEGTIAADVGLRENDQVLAVGGRAVFTEEEFNRALMSSRSSGERIPVIVRRDTGRTTLYIDPQMIRQSFAFSRGGADTDIGVTLMTGAEDRLIVQNVTGGIAARLGLRPNDVIVTVGGRRIASPAQFERIFHDVGFVDGRELPVVVFRNGRRVTLYFEPEIVQYRNRDRDYYRGEQEAWLGVTLNTNYEDYAVVQRVVPNSPADEAGVQPGDWIVRLNGRRVNSPSHLTSLVRSMEPGEELEIQVARRVSRTLMARLDASRPEPPRQALRPSYEEFQDFDDADLWQEERRLDGPDALEQFQPDLDRRGLRDRIGPGERGLRDRLDRDEVRDEPRGVLPR